MVRSLVFMLALSLWTWAEPPLFTSAATPPARELKEGELFPEAELTDSTGKAISLKTFRGQALAVTFIYTRCADVEFCPMVSRNFELTQQLLQRLGAEKGCHLLSITLDPEHDTAEALAAYAQGCQAKPAVWTLATGRTETIQQLGARAGLEIRRKGERLEHNLRTLVVDGEGKIVRIFRGDGWTPQELAALLQHVAKGAP